jgi:hypothetical protein
MTVFLRDAAGDAVAETAPDQTGAFAFLHLPAGSYRLRVGHDGIDADPGGNAGLGVTIATGQTAHLVLAP